MNFSILYDFLKWVKICVSEQMIYASKVHNFINALILSELKGGKMYMCTVTFRFIDYNKSINDHGCFMQQLQVLLIFIAHWSGFVTFQFMTCACCVLSMAVLRIDTVSNLE